MSRRRSMTIYAETLEDFTRTAISWAPHPVFPSPLSSTCRAKALQINTLCSPKSYNPDSSQRFERPWPRNVEQNWLEFDYDSTDSSPEQSLSHTDSIHDGLGVSRSTTDIPPCLLPLCKSRKIMVVGCRGTSRHNLVNSLFNDSRDDDLTPSSQTMDLILRTEETETQQIKYQFWIRTLSNPRLNSLVRLYHKRMDLFVFVYSTSSRSSFEALDNAIQSVLEDVKADKFKGVLIGLQTTDGEEQVSYTDGAALKRKYGLELFVETVYDDWQLKDKILSVIKD